MVLDSPRRANAEIAKLRWLVRCVPALNNLIEDKPLVSFIHPLVYLCKAADKVDEIVKRVKKSKGE